MTFQKGNKFGSMVDRTGKPNKLNIDVRQKFYKVYDNMSSDDTVSGDEAFIAWGRTNPSLFYTLFAKLLPKTIDGELIHKHESFVESLAQQACIKDAQASMIDTPAAQDKDIPHIVLDTSNSTDKQGNVKVDTPKPIHDKEIRD